MGFGIEGAELPFAARYGESHLDAQVYPFAARKSKWAHGIYRILNNILTKSPCQTFVARH
jgi:hypothetical protein